MSFEKLAQQHKCFVIQGKNTPTASPTQAKYIYKNVWIYDMKVYLVVRLQFWNSLVCAIILVIAISSISVLHLRGSTSYDLWVKSFSLKTIHIW